MMGKGTQADEEKFAQLLSSAQAHIPGLPQLHTFSFSGDAAGLELAWALMPARPEFSS